MNNYATGECVFLSNGCSTDDGAHINADWSILEVVDEDYRLVPAGTPGQKVLITNLANQVQPFIRYEVGDVVTMATTPCRCGSRLPASPASKAAAADVFWVGEGLSTRRMINLVLAHAFEYLTLTREWQADSTWDSLSRPGPPSNPSRGGPDLARAPGAIDRAGASDVRLSGRPRRFRGRPNSPPTRTRASSTADQLSLRCPGRYRSIPHHPPDRTRDDRPSQPARPNPPTHAATAS